MDMCKIASARNLLPVLLFLLSLSYGSGYAASPPLLKRLEKVEGLMVPADQIIKLSDKAVHDGADLIMNLKVDYIASPTAKGEGSPFHLILSIRQSDGGKIFTDGEGELCLIDKDGKIVLQGKEPLVKFCPT